MKAYWFSKEDNTTEHLKTPAEIGRTDVYEGELIPCNQGLHASPTPFDALQYAFGSILWEVEIDDDAIPHGDPINKYVSHHRTYLRRFDLTRLCYQFAAIQALSVIDKWDAPAIVREYLRDAAWATEWARAAARDARAAARTMFNDMVTELLEAKP